MATNPNIILAAGQGRPQSVDYNSAQNLIDADTALKAKQDQQDRQQAMQAQNAFRTALQQSGGDYDRAIAQSEQQGYDMTPVRLARTKLQEEIYKAGTEHLNQQKIEDDLVGRIFNTIDASDPVSVQRGKAMLMRVEPNGGWDQILGDNPTKEQIAQLGGLGMSAKEHADLAQKSLEAMKSGDWLGFLAAGRKSSNSPEDWQGITQVAQRLMIPQEMVAHVAQMTPDQLDEVITKGKQPTEKGGQHVEGMYHGKRTFGVFDPNTNTYNVDGKQVSASEFTPIPPASIILHNMGGGGGATGAAGGSYASLNGADKKMVDLIISNPDAINRLTPSRLQNIMPALAEKGFKDFGKVTNQTRTMAESAREIIPKIARVRDEATALEKSGLMGPIGSRWRDFINGTLKANELATDPQTARLIGQFQTDVGLLRTATARAHGGARGGGSPQMLEHMKEIIAATGDLPTFMGNLDSLNGWMQDYANMVPSLAGPNSGQTVAAPATAETTQTMVKMRAPGGQIKPVPADKVDFYRSRGAVVVK